jgi:hypothetical protein
MSDVLANDWWESSILASSSGPFGLSYQSSLGNDHIWENVDGDIETFIALEEILTGKRAHRWQHERLDWELHVRKLLHEKRFHIRYRMPLEHFDALVLLLGKDVSPDVTQSKRHNDAPIYPEIFVGVGIRYLAGGSYDDIMNTYGLSKSGFYYARNRFINAVLRCPSLDIKLPTQAEEWEKIRKGFLSKSSYNVITGCLGAIDGFFQPTICPTLRESEGFPRAYYSGHYQSTGLNCQAICDSKLRFLFFAVIAPGQTNDAVAYELTNLQEIIENFAPGSFIAGDAAYLLTEHLLVPFTGTSKQNPDKDSYNFYLSQLRIRIEMSFGLLTTKWRILRRKLETSLVNSSKILECCARLHNYVLNCKDDIDDDLEVSENEEELPTIHRLVGSPLGWGYLPTVEDFRKLPGTSLTRDAVLRKIEREGLRRPAHNLQRRALELEDLGLM